MKEKNNFIDRLPDRLFWDVDRSKLDPEQHSRWLIERILMWGSLDDFKHLLAYYGWDEIVKVAKKSRQIDCKTASFVAHMTGTPKDEFLCYSTKQSNRKLWFY